VATADHPDDLRPARLPVRQWRDHRDRDPARAGRLHILECQRLIRFVPKF
jgi:1,4-dihydroxy-2-naphthoyl-CoA synthase